MITVNEIIKSVFKKKLIINSGNHNSVKLRPGQNLKYDLPVSISDPLRARINAYWNEGKFIGQPAVQLPLAIEYFPAGQYDAGNILGSFRQKFKLTPRTFTFTDLEWKRFISKTFNNDGSNGVLSQAMIDKLETIRQIFLAVKNSNPNPNKVIISQTTIDNEFVPVYNEPKITFSNASKGFIQRVINRTEFEKRQGYVLNDAFKAGIDAVLLDIQRIIPIEAGLGAEWVLDDPRNDPKYLETENANIVQRLYNLLKTKQNQNSTYFPPEEVGFLNITANENKIKAPYTIVPRIKELALNFSIIYPPPENRDFVLDWAKLMTDFNRTRITEVSVDAISTAGSSGLDNLNAVGRENCDIQGAGSNTGEIGQGFQDRLDAIFGKSSYTPSSKVRDSISIGQQNDGTLTIESGFLAGSIINIFDDTSRPEGPDTIREGVLFEDYTFEANVPYSKKEVKQANLGANGFYEIFPEYNYFIENYENSINRPNVEETHLPNLYSFAIEKQENNLDEENTFFNKNISLGGYIKNTFVDVINASGKKIGEKSTGQYFEKFASVYDAYKSDVSVSEVMKRKFSNIIYPSDSAELFDETLSSKELFPMSININMNTDSLNKIVSLFNEINISTKLIKDTISNNLSVSKENFFTRLISIEQTIGNSAVVDRVQSQKLEDLNIYDITEWIEANLEDPSANISEDENSIVFSKIDPLDQGLGQDLVFENFLSNIVMISKVKDLIKEKIRTFEDIMTGKKCYNEVLFYKIEKLDSSGNVLQTFYISNSNKVAILNFIDTQVKYNKKYKYQIYSCNLVVGNKYRYNIESISSQSAMVEAIITPSIVIAEVPLAEKVVKIFDLPPVSPDVNLVPIKDANDRIKILLNSGVGKFSDFPIIVDEGDEEFFKTEYEVQEKQEDEPLDFNSDDPPAQFQVFRVDEKPTKHKDFENKLIAVIDTLHERGIRVSSGEYLDYLEPNRKYWYLFRSIDVHSNISNPSAIYEVEIVDDGGAVYPLISTIEIKPEKKQRKTKQMKKLLFIRPTLSQATINEQESGLFDENGNAIESIKGKTNFVMGLENEKVWGKNYKIRLTSKKTGRKIDVDFSFGHQVRPLQENE